VVSPAESCKGVGGVGVVKIFLPSGAASVWFEGDFDREIDAYEAKRLGLKSNDIEGAFVLSKNVPLPTVLLRGLTSQDTRTSDFCRVTKPSKARRRLSLRRLSTGCTMR
jgi:hypothetical protein